MKTFRLTALALGAVIVGSVSALAGPADDAIAARQACMKANGKAMGTFVPIIKKETAYDAAAVSAAVASMEAACAGWAGWWGDNTKVGETLPTRAKPEIWSDAAGFTAAGTAYMTALAAVKASTDEASFGAAFGALGGSCQGCHEKFQTPKG